VSNSYTTSTGTTTLADDASCVVVSPSVLGEDNGQLDYRLFDAVLTSDGTPPVDPEMEKFLPLLREYLTST